LRRIIRVNVVVNVRIKHYIYQLKRNNYEQEEIQNVYDSYCGKRLGRGGARQIDRYSGGRKAGESRNTANDYEIKAIYL